MALPCFFLSLFLLGWTSLSRNFSDQTRSFVVGGLSPLWHMAGEVKDYLSDHPIAGMKKRESIESSLIQLENQRLKAELEWAKEWMLHEPRVAKSSQLKGIPAEVIYRDPSSWSSSLWVGVGEEDNQNLGTSVVARNSPVVKGGSLVGVVEYVGKRQSRVRLITDSGLTPAVRVVRRGQPNEIILLIDALSEKLKEKEGTFNWIDQLQALKEKMEADDGEIYLAKGELRGNGAPYWRSRNPILKGVGFNYDYPDAEGSARELRTGKPLALLESPVPLISEGDLLVTSGLDGVFPRGISVAITTHVEPLKQGSFAYEIEAQPTAPTLNDLKFVFILPSLSGE
jgi:rod shape-determining protein MreC